MKLHTLNKIILGCFLTVLTGWLSPGTAAAQNSVIAEGRTTYEFNPGSGATTLSFTKLSNYTYGNQKVHVALALSPKPYRGGTFKPNFAKYVGELPARTYSKPFKVTGFGSYPKSGTYHVTIGIGVVNNQGGITLVSFLKGQQVTIGRKATRNRKYARLSHGATTSGTVKTDQELTVSIK